MQKKSALKPPPMRAWGSLAAKRALLQWRLQALMFPIHHNRPADAKSRNQLETRKSGRRNVSVLRPARGKAVDFLSPRETVRPMAAGQEPAGGGLAGVAGLGA